MEVSRQCQEIVVMMVVVLLDVIVVMAINPDTL